MTYGQIHSIESMGLVDGPGIRTVVFLQGCRLRCNFCHNPDTWSRDGGTQMTPEALVSRLLRYRPYFDRSGGGVTFSGGEPLLQPAFLAETLRLCKRAGIHTCVDTAGCGIGQYEEILDATDLLLYDVKAVTKEEYTAVTGASWEETRRFLTAVANTAVPMRVRFVVVPGRSDSDDAMKALRRFVRDSLPNVQSVELLPYHLLGENKYKALGIPYPLAGVPPMDHHTIQQYQQTYFSDEWRTLL